MSQQRVRQDELNDSLSFLRQYCAPATPVRFKPARSVHTSAEMMPVADVNQLSPIRRTDAQTVEDDAKPVGKSPIQLQPKAASFAESKELDFQQVVSFLSRRYLKESSSVGAETLLQLDADAIHAMCAGLRHELLPKKAPLPLPNSMREAMDVLRAGTDAVKFTRHGEHVARFLCVQTRRIFYDNDVALVPCLCWAASASAEPSSYLALPDLIDISGAPSTTMLRDARTGSIVGARGEAIADNQCISMSFASRSLDVALADTVMCDRWKRALLMVIDRNRVRVAAAQNAR